MGRMDITGPPTVTIEIPRFGGINTAQSFSEIDVTQSRDMLNLLPRSWGSIAKRDGTIPVTSTPLGSPIKVLCNLRRGGVNHILATSGTTLYKLDGDTLVAQTMEATLKSADIDYAQFKDANGQEVLIIADGGPLKYYDGTTVKTVTPADNDASPLPENDLSNINTNHPPKGVLVHNTRLVIWDGSDTIWHSKVGYFDYFPKINFQRFVRENDYVQTCISYGGALLVFMRRHIGVLFGDGYTSPPTSGDWSQDFLDTTVGCLNPKTVQIVVFPDGRQEVFYLSDNGVHSVYRLNTINLDSSSQYATRSVTDKAIDWQGLGVTKDEWKRATAIFHQGRYWLIYPKGTEWRGLVFDTTMEQWYPVDHIIANTFYTDEERFWYAGDTGHIHRFDSELYSDWDDKDKTTGTPIRAYWYSKLLTPGLTGYDHFWDVMMVEAKQHFVPSTLDVEVNTYTGQYRQAKAIKTSVMIIGVTPIGEGVIANPALTDLVNHAKRLRTFLKGQYAQIKISNERDEPIEVYSIMYEVRVSTKY